MFKWFTQKQKAVLGTSCPQISTTVSYVTDKYTIVSATVFHQDRVITRHAMFSTGDGDIGLREAELNAISRAKEELV